MHINDVECMYRDNDMYICMICVLSCLVIYIYIYIYICIQIYYMYIVLGANFRRMYTYHILFCI